MPSNDLPASRELGRDRKVPELERELVEAQARETATAEILRIIASSPHSALPVFEAIAKSAVGLCDALCAGVFSFDGTLSHFMAGHGFSQSALRHLQDEYPIGSRGVNGLAIADRTVVHVVDAFNDPRVANLELARKLGYRSHLVVPMLQGARVIGTINVYGAEPKPFSQAQIALLRTFADQAVVAIGNARLFEEVKARTRELSESLEQQTATSEVLQVIASSPSDQEPVFRAMLEKAVRICQANFGNMYLFEGGVLRLAAAHNTPSALVEARRQIQHRPEANTPTGRAARTRQAVHVADLKADQAYAEREPAAVTAVELGGIRTLLAVPMLKNQQLIGTISIYRQEVRPFTDKQIELVKSFASQAIIAIENARLFEAEQASKRELQESLAYQTAISDVLNVISRSPHELQPVIDAITRTAAELCNADYAHFRILRDGAYHVAANYGHDERTLARMIETPILPGVDSVAGRAALECATVHITNTMDDPAGTYSKQVNPRSHTMLGVPLVKDRVVLGVIVLFRKEVVPFSNHQIDLVKTFADQAVIAIENTRLFEEVQARTRELAKTIEDLEIASQHKSQFVANMSHELRTPLAAILGYAELMEEGFYGPQSDKSLDALKRIRSNGRHLLGLINTVLDIAKIESGQFKLNLTEYALESVVDTVRAATESLAETKKLALKTEVARSMPVGLGDEQRLTQVLLNLVGNAIKFTDTGEVHIIASAENGHFAVSVADTGPGIPADQLTRVFEQFHQVDSSNTKAKGGTGLGLAIAKQIVEMHGGRIWAESTMGKGSTFHMELPVRAAAGGAE